MKHFKAIGLMSGTSLDGIDAALMTTDGEGHIAREGFLTVPYDDILRQRIRACLNKPDADDLDGVERDITMLHARAVKRLLKEKKLEPGAVDLVGFHGQTIAHDPENHFTRQIGDGALLARETGIPVVNDFRTADVKAGGQGAPLAPVYHQALAAAAEKPVAFLNIGGVANVTFVGADGSVIAFDTGPGNALIDDWMLQKAQKKYDEGGKTAAQGKVDDPLLARLVAHPFFAQQPPKSLDRNAFATGDWQHLPLEDGAATLTAFTVATIVNAAGLLPEAPKKWIVSGGGRHNDMIMRLLAAVFGVPVVPIEETGLNGDAIEAEAFAYMAVRSFRGLPISFPTTTGVPEPMQGGRLNRLTDAA
jgi:anhydro-N-acetylmuramic acid kinase